MSTFCGAYSSVPNRRNKCARGKFSEKTLNVQDKIDQNRRAGGKFSEKSINVQGGSFWENQ